jgi:hypothetical protein
VELLLAGHACPSPWPGTSAYGHSVSPWDEEVGGPKTLEEDFAAYVAAHWPRLVRSAVLLGCTRPG